MASTAMTVFIAARAMKPGSSLFLGLDDLLAAVVTRRRDVVAQVRLARGGLDRDLRLAEMIVRPVHSAFRRRLLVLLNGHDFLLDIRKLHFGFFFRLASATKGDCRASRCPLAIPASSSPGLRGTMGRARSTASSTRSRTSSGSSATR